MKRVPSLTVPLEEARSCQCPRTTPPWRAFFEGESTGSEDALRHMLHRTLEISDDEWMAAANHAWEYFGDFPAVANAYHQVYDDLYQIQEWWEVFSTEDAVLRGIIAPSFSSREDFRSDEEFYRDVGENIEIRSFDLDQAWMQSAGDHEESWKWRGDMWSLARLVESGALTLEEAVRSGSDCWVDNHWWIRGMLERDVAKVGANGPQGTEFERDSLQHVVTLFGEGHPPDITNVYLYHDRARPPRRLGLGSRWETRRRPGVRV